jgi:hypothetical protein
MRKVTMLLLFIVVAFAFLIAQDEVAVWQWNPLTEEWEINPQVKNARAFTSMSAQGACNKVNWEIKITTEVQVAQWVKWKIDGTKWTWFVRKPGDYYTNSVKFFLQSNSDIILSASGFGDLEYFLQDQGVNRFIETYWFATLDPAGTPLVNDWTRAEAVNGSLTVPDSQELHNGMVAYLWNRIRVVECNSASTYRNTGTITITLKNQKHWITDEGEYVSDLASFVTSLR